MPGPLPSSPPGHTACAARPPRARERRQQTERQGASTLRRPPPRLTANLGCGRVTLQKENFDVRPPPEAAPGETAHESMARAKADPVRPRSTEVSFGPDRRTGAR